MSLDPNAPRPPVTRSPAQSETDIARQVPYRVFKPGPSWTTPAVFKADPLPPNTPNHDDGSWADALRSGNAVSAVYRTGGSNQVAEVLSGPRDATLARLKRGPAQWDTASAVNLTVAGQPVTGWLVRATSGKDAGQFAIFADLGDTFLVVQFSGFDEAAVAAFMSQLSAVQR